MSQNNRMTAVVCHGPEHYRVEQLGDVVAINPREEDTLAVVQGLTGGYGCDFVEFLVFGADTTVDWSIIGDRKEMEVRGSHLGPYCYPIAIDLLDRGLVTSQGIVTHGYAIDERDEAIRVASSLDSIKVLLRPVP